MHLLPIVRDMNCELGDVAPLNLILWTLSCIGGLPELFVAAETMDMSVCRVGAVRIGAQLELSCSPGLRSVMNASGSLLLVYDPRSCGPLAVASNCIALVTGPVGVASVIDYVSPVIALYFRARMQYRWG